MGDDTGVWQAEIAPLARKHHVIAIDQIGFGRSDKPLLNYRVGTLVDFLDEFMATQHIAHATIVGNSLGGWVGALFAIDHPERVEKLVLVDSPGAPGYMESLEPRVRSALRLATVEDVEVLAPLAFFDSRYYEPKSLLRTYFAEKVAANDSYATGRLMDSFERNEDTLGENLKKIGRPTLVVWGRADRLVPLQFGEYLQRSIPGAHLIVLDRCGHEPQVECAEAFEKALEDFLGQ
jgi:pimeloyl-ACP methyl ester carboxylesterase